MKYFFLYFFKIRFNNRKISLEIGTFDGANAFLLSKLFEKSKIETIDLDKNSEDFKNIYNRKLFEFMKIETNYYLKSKNINFKI